MDINSSLVECTYNFKCCFMCKHRLRAIRREEKRNIEVVEVNTSKKYLLTYHCLTCNNFSKKDFLYNCKVHNRLELISVPFLKNKENRYLEVSCMKDKTVTCEICGDDILISQSTEVYGDRICWECFDNNFAFCSECGEIIDLNEYYHIDDNKIYCYECTNDLFNVCDSCGDLIKDEDTVEDDGETYCTYCYENKSWEFENSLLYGYHDYELDEFDFIGEPKNDVYFGLELETENNICLNEKHNIVKPIEKIIEPSAIDKYGHYEEDGSISGIEYITAPMDSEILIEKADEIVKTLDSFGLSVGNSTGIHIHVSRNDFVEKKLASIIRFIENNKKEVMLLSGRTEEALGKWAKFRFKGNENNLAMCSKNYGSRYTAVNTTNDNTIEFRFFSSSLDARIVKGYIEFIELLVYSNLNQLISFRDLLEYAKQENYSNFIRLYRIRVKHDFYY